MVEKKKFITDLYELNVKDIMKNIESGIPFIEKNADITSILSTLNKKKHVWVVDSKENLHIQGVITESDTLMLFSPPITPMQSFDKPALQSLEYGLTTTAEEIMSKNPIKVSPNEKIKDIIIIMKQHNIKQIPVVDEKDKLLGEITLHHFINKYNKEKPKNVEE
jgi:predicted transcriptional regulator